MDFAQGFKFGKALVTVLMMSLIAGFAVVAALALTAGERFSNT